MVSGSSRAAISGRALGTRSEIARSDLNAHRRAKAEWLPRIARVRSSTAVLPSQYRSDLASLSTRAVATALLSPHRSEPIPCRPRDLMTVLARTNPGEGLCGLRCSWPEPRATDEDPFRPRASGARSNSRLSRMKEYDVSSTASPFPRTTLGRVEGQGFKQLMQTFEAPASNRGARIGVAQSRSISACATAWRGPSASRSSSSRAVG